MVVCQHGGLPSGLSFIGVICHHDGLRVVFHQCSQPAIRVVFQSGSQCALFTVCPDITQEPVNRGEGRLRGDVAFPPHRSYVIKSSSGARFPYSRRDRIHDANLSHGGRNCPSQPLDKKITDGNVSFPPLPTAVFFVAASAG